tara:strand:+ start:4295 stop:8512 length:4218 start_codon:yes stop_codon:yes gene_type:complete
MSVHQKIAIPTLAGGVGRQASNKRLPTEAQDLDNVIVTTERSVEKRPALEWIAGADIIYGDNTTYAPGSLLFNTLADGSRYVPSANDDIFFKWISIDQDNRFLIAINYSLTLTNGILDSDAKKKFITVWKLNVTNKRMDLQTFDTDSITLSHYNYLTANPDGSNAEKTLSFALFGTALVALNKQVSAGYREGATKTVLNSYNEGTEYNSGSHSFVLRSNKVDGLFDHFTLEEGATGGTRSTRTFRGFPIDNKNKNGLKPETFVLSIYSNSDRTTLVGSFKLVTFKDPNLAFKLKREDLELLSGRFPLDEGFYYWSVTPRAEDVRGRPIQYRVSALPTTKNLVPISETTLLSALDTNPTTKLFDGDQSSPKMHLINNRTTDTNVGNVKDPSTASTGDTYFADKFFISRGSVQYGVELNEYDTSIQPGSIGLAPKAAAANQAVALSDLKVTQKLRPLTAFTINSGTGITVDADGEVSVTGDNLVSTPDETKTIKDLKDLIEASGADATLKIDSDTNRISIIDDSQENLTLLATGENFNTGQAGNQNFVETLGLGNTNSKALRTINRNTLIFEELFDVDGNKLITLENRNDIKIFSRAINTQTNKFSDLNSFTVSLVNLDSKADLLQLAEKIRESTRLDDAVDPTYVLCYADNNLEIVGTGTDNKSDESVGLQVLTFTDSTGKKPDETGFDATKRTVALVMDVANTVNTKLFTLMEEPAAEFGKLLGIRNMSEDHTLVVEDKNFNISQQTDLGQSIVSFQNVPIPTSNNDTIKVNNAEETLFSLYENGPLTSGAKFSSRGRGKVYEARERFFDFTPGFYRAIAEPDKGNPYYEKVRSEAAYSVWDENTLPIIIDFDSSSGLWKLITPSWQPRKSGDLDSNPGPSPFIDSANTNNRIRRRISSITTWRNRLWFAIDDTVFSSEFGQFFNLFLTDPGTITDVDVIDVRSSVDKICKINNMIAFYDFLFINTDNDVQFELQGSENQITPFTAELSPTTFYSTDPIARPQLLGSQIYFFAPEKVYLYYSTANQNVITQAVETSAHCEGYLPKNYGAIARAPAQDLIAMVDADKKNEMYLYVNKFSGDKIQQNALYRYIFDTNFNIQAMESFDNFMYMVGTRPYSNQSGDTTNQFYIHRTFLEQADKNQPRLDNLMLIAPDSSGTDATVTYDAATNKTTFILPMQDAKIDTAVFSEDFFRGTGKVEFQSVPATVTETTAGQRTRVTIDGDFNDVVTNQDNQGSINGIIDVEEEQGLINSPTTSTEDQGFLLAPISGGTRGVFFGNSYDMNIQLSTQFIRDGEMNVVDGVLNLRTISTRYSDTGIYSVKIQRKGDTDFKSVTTKRNPFYRTALNNKTQLDQAIPIDEEGEFVAKVFGDSERMNVFITSDHYTPCNITHIEFKGVFKQTYRSGQN